MAYKDILIVENNKVILNLCYCLSNIVEVLPLMRSKRAGGSMSMNILELNYSKAVII